MLYSCLRLCAFAFLRVIPAGQKPGGGSRGSSLSGQLGPPPPFIPQSSPHGTRLPGPPPPGMALGPPPLGPLAANGGPPPRQILPGTCNKCIMVYTP